MTAPSNDRQRPLRIRHWRSGKTLLRFATMNARSLRNKINDLRDFVKAKHPKIVSVTESWGKDWMSDGSLSLEGYIMYRSDRKGSTGETRGGGTILYVRSDVEQRSCKALNTGDFESSAWCWIIEKGGKKILVGSVYRSPNCSQENNELLLQKMQDMHDIAGDNRIFLLGDFNLPNIDWVGKRPKVGAKRFEYLFLEATNDCFLHQHVTENTRYCGLQASLLDLVFTKEERDVINIEILAPLGQSDHGIICGDLVTKWMPRKVHRPRRMYHKGDFKKVNDELRRIDWESLFVGKSADGCWRIFRAKVEELINLYVPLEAPRDFNQPWMNRSLLRLWKKKYYAWKRYTDSKSYQKYEEYKKEAKKFKNLSRKVKRLHVKKLARGVTHKNKKAFFRYVNSKLTVRPEITEIKNASGALVDKDKDIADAFNKYFSSVHTPPSDELMPEMEDNFVDEISNINVTRGEVQTILSKINVNKSCGPDNIHPLVLQKTAEASSNPLTLIFNRSLSTGELPDDWRTANVTPIHKKGDKTDPSNYRPVSLTSQVCKVLETIVRRHLVAHLDRNNILSDKQHGFREGRSCLTNLLELVEVWTEILDQEDGIDVAYLDFRKAFDLVSHRHLLFKMKKYGITSNVLNWVEAFLSNRTQRVVIRGSASEPERVTSGVPQGSVLGPTLFLIFINDLPLEVISHVSLFADDSKIFTRIVSEKNEAKWPGFRGDVNLQRDLNRVRDWARKWKMDFNVGKCKIMHLGKENPKNKYYMGGAELMVTSEEKDLGVVFDEALEFEKHIRGIVNKANRMLGLIRIGFNCLDEVSFKSLYLVLVRPLLEYCVQVWSPYKQRYIDIIERVQERATKLVPSVKNLPYEDRLKKLGLTTLVERRYRGDMIETYKILTGKEKLDPARFFKMSEERGDPQLARGLKLSREREDPYSCQRRKNTFSLRVVKPWNKLGREEVNAVKTGGFKSRFDRNEIDRRSRREGRDGRVYNNIYITGGVTG